MLATDMMSTNQAITIANGDEAAEMQIAQTNVKQNDVVAKADDTFDLLNDPAELYGYGDATPDISFKNMEKKKKKKKKRTSSTRSSSFLKDANAAALEDDEEADLATTLYGYEDAAPQRRRRSSCASSGSVSSTGSGQSSTSSGGRPPRRKSSHRRASIRSSIKGKIDPSLAASLFGYEDAAPSQRRRSSSSISSAAPSGATSGTAAPATPRTQRRSSMKQSNTPSSSTSRRASIQLGEERQVTLLSGEKITRRTSISFDEAVEVNPVTRIMDLTKRPEKLWFQEDEYHRMREKCYKYVDLHEQQQQGKRGGGVGVETGDDDQPTTMTKEGSSSSSSSKQLSSSPCLPCIRGLEGMLEEQSNQKQKLRGMAWDSVLSEQERQFDSQTYDDQAMANALKLVSIESRVEAARRARLDEQEVKIYLSSTRRMCRRLTC